MEGKGLGAKDNEINGKEAIDPSGQVPVYNTH